MNPAFQRSRGAAENPGHADLLVRYWWVVILATAALALPHLLAQRVAVLGALHTASNAVGAAAVILALMRRPGLGCRRGRNIIAIALVCFTVGHIVWYSLTAAGAEGYLFLPNILYLIGYLLFAVGLWQFGGTLEAGAGALLDALIVVVAAAVLFWAILIVPFMDPSRRNLTQLLFSASYPVIDLLYLTIVLKLLFMSLRRTATISLLLGATFLAITADVIHAFGVSAGWYSPGGPLDLAWMFTYALIGAAALHPAATQAVEVRASATERPIRRLTLIGVTAISVPTVILLTADVQDQLLRIAAAASIILFLLMMMRLGVLLRENRAQAVRLEELVRTDSLTQVANRRAMEERLLLEIERVQRTGKPLTVAFLDLDYFKSYNDRFGHGAGDRLLQSMAESWRAAVRANDFLTRYGGEEFVLLCPDTDPEAARPVLERLRETVPHGESCSVGVTQYRSGDDTGTLLHRADKALYAAKNGGRNLMVYHDD